MSLEAKWSPDELQDGIATYISHKLECVNVTETLVLGLDGATWDVLHDFIRRDRLPNLDSLATEGRFGRLESTFPPITAPAWLSMATGQNPGKTGVFYFLNRSDPDSYEFESLSSDKFRNQSFWDVLNEQDTSVGVFNYPMLYPPYDLKNGFMISGLGSPEDETIAKPDGLLTELQEVVGEYQIKVPYADPKYADNPELLHQDLLDAVETREAAIEYLLTEKDPDVFFGVVSATDWVQHYFWRQYDPDHPLHDAEDSREYVTTLWERVDELIGMVVEFAESEDAHLLLVSDHGFGPVNQTFHSNDWLVDEGFQSHESQSVIDKLRVKAFPYLKRIGKPVVSLVPQLNEVATSVGRTVRGNLEDVIDMEESIVFAPRQNLTCGMLYTLSDDPADEAAVIDALESLTIDGEPLDVEVYRPEDLYEGDKLDVAPDILFKINDFACAVDPRPATDSILAEGPPSPARSGGHRQDGMYLFSGPGVNPGEGPEHSLLDIAPTLLYLTDTPIPETMDGEPMTDAFIDEFNDKRDRRSASLASLVGESEPTADRDTEAVQERLEDLGYI